MPSITQLFLGSLSPLKCHFLPWQACQDIPGIAGHVIGGPARQASFPVTPPLSLIYTSYAKQPSKREISHDYRLSGKSSRRNSAVRLATVHRPHPTGGSTLHMKAYLHSEASHGSMDQIEEVRVNAPEKLGNTRYYKGSRYDT